MAIGVSPIKDKKNPLIAGLIGFAFGGIGLGLYFRSFKDFLYPILVMLLLSFLFPGVGTVAGIALTTLWGIIRAEGSGKG